MTRGMDVHAYARMPCTTQGAIPASRPAPYVCIRPAYEDTYYV